MVFEAQVTLGDEPDQATRLAYPRIARINRSGGYPAARTSMGLPAVQEVIAATPTELATAAQNALAHATVWSGEPGVDPTAATAPALAAAADLPVETAQAYVATRAFEGPLTPLPAEADLSSLRRSEGRVARLSVRVETKGGGRAALTVVMERTGSPRAPIRFLSWR